MAGLDEPLAEIPLNGDMQHFLLIGSKLRTTDLLLDFFEMLCPDLEDIIVLLRAKEKLMISEFLWQRELHEIYWLHKGVART